MLRYFHQINKMDLKTLLGYGSFYSGIFIKLTYYGLFSIPIYFVISLRFIVKLSPLLVIFSCKGFHVNLVFISLFCISLLCHLSQLIFISFRNSNNRSFLLNFVSNPFSST